MYDKLISDLREYAGWAEANSYEVPVDMPDLLREAADTMEKMERERDAAVSEMSTLARAVREGCDDTDCCGLCEYDDRPFYEECPGWNTFDCFKWRGVKEATE